MKISHENEKTVYLFEIGNGGCFFDPTSDSYNIKTSEKDTSGDILIVNLADGDPYHESPKSKVVPVDAEISVRYPAKTTKE